MRVRIDFTGLCAFVGLEDETDKVHVIMTNAMAMNDGTQTSMGATPAAHSHGAAGDAHDGHQGGHGAGSNQDGHFHGRHAAVLVIPGLSVGAQGTSLLPTSSFVNRDGDTFWIWPLEGYSISLRAEPMPDSRIKVEPSVAKLVPNLDAVFPGSSVDDVVLNHPLDERVSALVALEAGTFRARVREEEAQATFWRFRDDDVPQLFADVVTCDIETPASRVYLDFAPTAANGKAGSVAIENLANSGEPYLSFSNVTVEIPVNPTSDRLEHFTAHYGLLKDTGEGVRPVPHEARQRTVPHYVGQQPPLPHDRRPAPQQVQHGATPASPPFVECNMLMARTSRHGGG